MAAPHVSAVAALVWSAMLNATNTEVRAALIASAEDLGVPGHDKIYGSGLVRAKKAIDFLVSSAARPRMNVEINILTDDYPSETTWTLKDQCGMGISIRGGYSFFYPMEPMFLVSVNHNLPLGKYTFTIFDSAGDGICSPAPESYCGSYKILADGVTKLTGGVFDFNDVKTFGNCVTYKPSRKPTSKPTTRKPTTRKPKPTTPKPITRKPRKPV